MNRPAKVIVALCIGLGIAAAVLLGRNRGDPSANGPNGGGPATPEAPSHGIRFANATAEAGIEFHHFPGATGRKFIVETMGSGGGFFDYDGDGDMDIYLVNGAPFRGMPDAPPPPETAPRNALYRNDGDGTFTDVTEASGTGDTGYGMGCAMADYDGDGDVDLYVTNFGPNVLYRNRGDGTFEEVGAAAGVDDRRWGSSCLFADLDRDGWLDLYVVNYLETTVEDDRHCGEKKPGWRTYCHPYLYDGVPDVYYRNRGDGTFEDWTARGGVGLAEGRGLGVVGTDFDNDGDLDIYVANDFSPNFLLRNRGDGTFEEVGEALGVAYGERGMREAGMGVDAADVDGDGWPELWVTNFSQETNSLYGNLGGELFEDRVAQAGLASASFVPLAFGTGFFDLDLDGALDLVVGNGHVEDVIHLYFDFQTHAQPNQVFRNRGHGTFEEISATVGESFAARHVTRGLAAADYDLDGDLDLLITNCDGPARLLRNDSTATGSWISLLPLTGSPPRVAWGARLELTIGGRTIVREVRPGGSYLSQHEPWVHVGLGKAKKVERLGIVWPSGRKESFEGLASGRRYRVDEGGKPEPIPPR